MFAIFNTKCFSPLFNAIKNVDNMTEIMLIPITHSKRIMSFVMKLWGRHEIGNDIAKTMNIGSITFMQ